MRDIAIAQGIPPDRIELEPRARNTYENVMYVQGMLRERNWRNVLLVSSPYHMRRAMMVWKKVARANELVSRETAGSGRHEVWLDWTATAISGTEANLDSPGDAGSDRNKSNAGGGWGFSVGSFGECGGSSGGSSACVAPVR